LKKPTVKDLGSKWRDTKQAALQSPRTRAALAGMGRARNALLNLPGAKTTLSKWRRFTEVYSGSSCLGIHCTSADMTAVLLERRDGGLERTDTIKLKIEPSVQKPEAADHSSGPDDAVLRTLQQLYTRMIPRDGKAHPVALSLGADFYQTQFHHSDFEQAEQIKQTLRFDIEDEFVVEAENIFLCFQQMPTPAEGCDLMVYTANREDLILTTQQFEQAGLDALVAEPDVVSWRHYLENQEDLIEDQGLIIAGRCADSIYVLILNQDNRPILTRNFICPDIANFEEFLARELPRCLALIETPPARMVYHGQGFDRSEMNALSQTLSLDIRELPQQDIREAFAEGVARGLLDARVESDFRGDGLVPRTMEKAQHKALLCLSVVVSLFLLVSVVVMKNKTDYYHEMSDLAEQRIDEVYEMIPHSGRRTNKTKAIRELARGYRRKNVGAGSTDLPNSIGHTFQLFVLALQRLPNNFDIVLDTLRFRSDSVDLSGSVASLDGCQRLEQEVKAQPSFRVEKWDYNPVSDRWEYNMAVSAKSNKQKREGRRGNRNRHAATNK